MTPLKAIRAKCLDCCCGQANEVKLCPFTRCALYEYRTGHGPKKQLTDEQRAEIASRFKNAHKNGANQNSNP